jgi:hypothetical protein
MDRNAAGVRSQQNELPNMSGLSLGNVVSVITNRVVASLNKTETASEVNSEAGNAFGGRTEAAHRRKAMAYRSSNRRNGYVRIVAKIDSIWEAVVGKCEFDSHADTSVVGKNFVVISYTGRLCDVSPYSDTYDAVVGVPIVSAATLYTDVQTGFLSMYLLLMKHCICHISLTLY